MTRATTGPNETIGRSHPGSSSHVAAWNVDTTGDRWPGRRAGRISDWFLAWRDAWRHHRRGVWRADRRLVGAPACAARTPPHSGRHAHDRAGMDDARLDPAGEPPERAAHPPRARSLTRPTINLA